MEFLGPHNVTITLILCEYYNPQNASNFLNFRLNSKNFFLKRSTGHWQSPQKNGIPLKGSKNTEKNKKKRKKCQSTKHNLCEISSHKNASNFLKFCSKSKFFF